MGTHGYMAPEMVKLLGQKRYERVGYTELIDYWSLGVTIYKLLAGKRPFDKKRFEKVMDESVASGGDKAQVNKEYELLKQEIVYPSYFQSTEKSLIVGLLQVEESDRLGAKGTDELKGHPYFSNIDWDKLIQKHVIPPFMPAPKMYPTRDVFHDFEDMLSTLTKQRKASGHPDVDWKEEIDSRDLPLFDTWDFISPHTLKVEMGIAGEVRKRPTAVSCRVLFFFLTISMFCLHCDTFSLRLSCCRWRRTTPTSKCSRSWAAPWRRALGRRRRES